MPQEQEQQHVILFYKYHPLAKEEAVVELYRSALERLCTSLNLQGRILVGCNEHQSEGINGTLSGRLPDVKAFTQALMQYDSSEVSNSNANSNHLSTSSEDQDPTRVQAIIGQFWNDCRLFYEQAKCPDNPLVMSETEFKWSSTTIDTSRSRETETLFPDLHIKLVKEMIGTGGVLASIPLEETSKGYLTPQQWHERLTQSKNDNDDDTLLIDCRNTKEWQIGHFPQALDPNTTTFGQFPTWVQQHSQTLANKNILMYCTGGIRCEKASAYIRRQVPSVKEVSHLQGGIHKYLDEFGGTTASLWQGKNFVFDGRLSATTNNNDTHVHDQISSSSSTSIVGECAYCAGPYDTFHPHCVCTVCREPTLVCIDQCQDKLIEYHCRNHKALRHCYFTDLSRFNTTQLENQRLALQTLAQEIAVGRKYKQKRKTLFKQCDKIQERLQVLAQGDISTNSSSTPSQPQAELKCRNCGDIGCSGSCWGFHSLKRKQLLDQRQNELGSVASTSTKSTSSAIRTTKANGYTQNNNNGHLRLDKELQRQQAIDELLHLQLCQVPCANRDSTTGIRVPFPCTRVLQTTTKGKWCGRSLLQVVQEEFSELSKPDVMASVLERGLLRVNDTKITNLIQAESLRLKNMDIISRVVHWHEPPVIIPSETISVQKITFSDVVRAEYGIQTQDDEQAALYICDKPSSVPVHPAGPYLSNTLTLMVEAQEKLTPKSLIPCHRLDRGTSGLTLCCTNVKVARLIQGRIEEGAVQKLYLAKVHGQFPCSNQEATTTTKLAMTKSTDIAKWSWCETESSIRLEAPIETVDPANGIRKITEKGKPAQSLFKLVSFDKLSNTSFICCRPLTGRSHQLRVHLQWLGFPVVNDVQYGGSEMLTIDSQDGILKVLESMQHTSEEPSSKSLSNEDIQAARETCRCCQSKQSLVEDGIVASFTKAQLLQRGFSICLHAYRYNIPILSKKKKHKPMSKVPSETETPIAELDLQVGLPKWAPADFEPSQIQWLQGN